MVKFRSDILLTIELCKKQNKTKTKIKNIVWNSVIVISALKSKLNLL